ncbi:hypothetical protein [Polyangium jinanense]|uniref:Uncharacterized protein n=1 Tax=Polyangium jinanense TaxID=2829994 RepID=A0A9X3XA40_9BACT|nr:hypothetical protein [Polyangium jinanense]MDC3961174.1 hypothetical protein [Polyangium jinanense]MDC3986477.1 hypothetical protein [Polyangium jinanense]
MSLPDGYSLLRAEEKLDALWARVSSDPYPEGALPTSVPGPWGRRKLFSTAFNRGSFELSGDELPPDRPKLVHTYGTCARVTLKITAELPYTGVLAKGGSALLRFSDAKGGGSFAPSIALKFFVTGKPSLNFLGLPNDYREKGDLRCFSSVYCNSTVPAKEFDTKLVQAAFQKAANSLGGTRLYSVYLPLHHLAGMGADGATADNPVVPDRIEFHPTAEAKRACPDTSDFRLSLGRVPAGIKLFDVHVAPKIDQPTKPLGELWLDSAFVASKYGDERLFFAHDVGPTTPGPH